MTDRAIRNLAHLKRSASTARVLNLLKVADEHDRTDDWIARPMFQTPALNAALVIKHRLRRNEIDAFTSRRQVATKVVIPIDSEDLKSGGRYVFVNQRGFEAALQETFGVDADHPDVRVLRLMDELPSLDPFLLREQLRRAGVDPAPCYFALSEADLDRMTAFVEGEIEPLVTLSLGPDVVAVGSARKMAATILSNRSGARMEALRETLRLDPDQYEEGVFCWKGFLYYKWALKSLMAEVLGVADAVWSVRPVGPVDAHAREYLDRGREVLRRRILKTCEDAHDTLAIYDRAYAALTVEGRPTAFRDFLLEAPAMFSRLGEQLGTIQHVVSFWRFRFAPGAAQVGVEELIDIFMDFETGLRGREDPALEYGAAA